MWWQPPPGVIKTLMIAFCVLCLGLLVLDMTLELGLFPRFNLDSTTTTTTSTSRRTYIPYSPGCYWTSLGLSPNSISDSTWPEPRIWTPGCSRKMCYRAYECNHATSYDNMKLSLPGPPRRITVLSWTLPTYGEKYNVTDLQSYPSYLEPLFSYLKTTQSQWNHIEPGKFPSEYFRKREGNSSVCGDFILTGDIRLFQSVDVIIFSYLYSYQRNCKFDFRILPPLDRRKANQLWLGLWGGDESVSYYPFYVDTNYLAILNGSAGNGRGFYDTFVYSSHSCRGIKILYDRPFSEIASAWANYTSSSSVFRWEPYPPSAVIPHEAPKAPMIALIGNCDPTSGRNEILHSLLSHMAIDSYGSCLHNRNESTLVADYYSGASSKRSLYSGYPFCIAIENSVCMDYVSEKVFEALQAGCIPIFRGSPNIDQYIPDKDAVIFIDDFRNPEELVAYLKRVLSQKSLFEKHHGWRRRERPDHLVRMQEHCETNPTCEMLTRIQFTN